MRSNNGYIAGLSITPDGLVLPWSSKRAPSQDADVRMVIADATGGRRVFRRRRTVTG